MALSRAIVVGPDRHGRSVAIVDGRVVAAAPAGATRLACADGEIAPGAVCAHTHLYSGLAPLRHAAAGAAAADFPADTGKGVVAPRPRARRRESRAPRRAITSARALLAGTTTLVDHHESPNLIEGSLAILAEACEELGVRALLCYGASERNFGREEARRGLDECRRVARLRRSCAAWSGCTRASPFPTTPCARPATLARELGTVVHVHVAEDHADVDDARRRGTAGPLERLLSLDALPPGSILAHGVRLSAR